MTSDFSSVVVPFVVGVQAGTEPPAAAPVTSAPAAANPNMVGLPDGSQPLASNGVAAVPGQGVPSQAAPASPFGPSFLLPLVGFMALMIIMQVFSGRKEKKKRAELMASMKRGDRVQTIGGVIGTIAEIRDDDIVLRLEEGKMRVTRSSVQTVLKESKAGESPALEVKAGREKASV